MKKTTIFIVVIAVALIGWFVWNKQHTPKSSVDKTALATFNKQQHSLTDPNSIWVIVNKHQPLGPKTYAPSDLVTPNVPVRTSRSDDEMKLRSIAVPSLEQMFAAAQKDGINLMIASGYRSYDLQTQVYNGYIQTQGKAAADSQSARPGYSEHQTGLAADLEPTSRKCEVDPCFATTPEGKWLAANSYKYGFILRYPLGLQNIVGYVYEPWHVRYIGTDAALEMHYAGTQTLEQFFGLPAAPDYQ